MKKTFTPCPDNFGKLTQNTGVTAGPVACPSVVCCTTNTNHIKNNYKDDSANAGSFSFIQKNNLNTTAFMKTLLRKSKFVSLLFVGLFLALGICAQTTTVFPTTSPWSVPANASKIKIEIWGGGGAGGGVLPFTIESGAGGGAGGYSSKIKSSSLPGTIAFTIGTWGNGGQSTGGNGVSSTCDGMTANGGTGGT